MKSVAKLCLVLVAIAVTSCTDTVAPVPPIPGTLLLQLTSANEDDAALLLHLSGPGIGADAVTAANGAQQLFARSDATGIRVAVFGSVRSGPLLRVRVADVSRGGEYHADFIEVADARSALRQAVTGYSGHFVRE